MGMLGSISVKDFHGPLTDLMNKIQGDDGEAWFKAFKRFLRKQDPWPNDHLIDCTAQPHLVPGSLVIRHRVHMPFIWNEEEVKLHWIEKQKTNAGVSGITISERLPEIAHLFQPSALLMNACVLDYLLLNPELIPEEWKQYRGLFFWGTVFSYTGKGKSMNSSIRYLMWNQQEEIWEADFEPITSLFGANCPAVLFHSTP